MFLPGMLDETVAIVTGGGTGIGLACAREMASLGAKIAINGRRPEPLEEARRSLEAEGYEVYAAPADIRDVDAVGAFVGSVLERFGHIDVLVNNAGGQFPTPAEHLAPKGFEAVVRNNLLGTWVMTHAVATRAMIPAKRGRIVNVIAQIARGFPGMAHTGAARAGVDNLTKTLAIEWAHYGIRTNAVAPGVIKSSGTDRYPPELIDIARRRTPLKRAGTAEEVAHLVTYLVSPAADFITGQTLYIDGGQSLWGDLWDIPDPPA